MSRGCQQLALASGLALAIAFNRQPLILRVQYPEGGPEANNLYTRCVTESRAVNGWSTGRSQESEIGVEGGKQRKIRHLLLQSNSTPSPWEKHIGLQYIAIILGQYLIEMYCNISISIGVTRRYCNNYWSGRCYCNKYCAFRHFSNNTRWCRGYSYTVHWL